MKELISKIRCKAPHTSYKVGSIIFSIDYKEVDLLLLQNNELLEIYRSTIFGYLEIASESFNDSISYIISKITNVNWLLDSPIKKPIEFLIRNSDIVDDKVLVRHNLQYMYCNVKIIDNNDTLVSSQKIKYIDNNLLAVYLSPIIGTWKIVCSV